MPDHVSEREFITVYNCSDRIKTLINKSSNKNQAANLIGFSSAGTVVDLFPKKKKKS